ncbi:glycosyltransferase [Cronbergia sp. UHCC 0137]|uniref:glycosyltransferase n=1 Tax=Cronbergia sp. UHCC 0137 TaxID=3110239 RepID=UPI002B1EA98C|nr:glycosyltransferase [Cronbergia sp. UHCC 0137]MEA5620672.1 glycosyltransferase [Cronbergia sp. UHCC 0137]
MGSNLAVFVFSPGENHIRYLERVFDSIADTIRIDFKFCVFLPRTDIKVKSKYPICTKTISPEDIILCQDLYYQEGRADIPSFAAYAQLFLPKYFSEYSSFLFMEVDQIVRKDLAPLWQQCVNDDVKLGAVRSQGVDGSYLAPPDSFKKLHPDGCYHNMGVVYVNTNYWNQNDFFNKCIYELKLQKDSSGERLDFYAQGAMNNAIHQYVSDLDHKYNVTGLGYQENIQKEILEGAAILHWSGSRKPWHPDGMYKNFYYNNYRGGLLSIIEKFGFMFVK